MFNVKVNKNFIMFIDFVKYDILILIVFDLIDKIEVVIGMLISIKV